MNAKLQTVHAKVSQIHRSPALIVENFVWNTSWNTIQVSDHEGDRWWRVCSICIQSELFGLITRRWFTPFTYNGVISLSISTDQVLMHRGPHQELDCSLLPWLSLLGLLEKMCFFFLKLRSSCFIRVDLAKTANCPFTLGSHRSECFEPFFPHNNCLHPESASTCCWVSIFFLFSFHFQDQKEQMLWQAAFNILSRCNPLCNV